MFRLMTVSHHAEGNPSHYYLAVTKQVKHATEEHKSFWKYTPHGEIELTLGSGREAGNAGDYYYVDLKEGVQSDETWKLIEVSQQESTFTAEFRRHWSQGSVRSGKMTVTICNDALWDRFSGAVGNWWEVSFVPAEAPED
jgi:hypothetical protein